MVLYCKNGIFKEYFKFICVQQSFWILSPQSTAKTRYQNERTAKMLQLQTDVVLWWGLWAATTSYRSSAGATARPCYPRSLLVVCCHISNIPCPGWQAHICPAASPPSRTGEKTGAETARKLIGRNIDGKITYQVVLGAKQTQLREFNLLFWGKSWQTLRYLSSKFPMVNSLQALLCFLVTTASASQPLQWDRGSQKLLGMGVVPDTKCFLCAAPFLFLCSDIAPPWAAALWWEYLHRHGSFPESHYYVQQFKQN